MGGSEESRTLVELASGIDALYMSGRGAVPASVLDRLADARLAADSASASLATELGGCEFTVAPGAFGKHRYQLVHSNGIVGITASERLPAFRIQPRAEFLHGVGTQAAVQWFRDLLERECGPVALTTSRIDLHADWQGWELTWADRERFVCRADAVAIRGERGELTGMEFGRRDTNAICARIYDKTRQVKSKGIDYWFDIWSDRYRPELPVLRVEFEFGRKGLREFGIETPEDAIAAAGGLWMSVAHDWLSFRTATGDSTRSRWPVADEWLQIQRAAIGDGAHGLERMREGNRRGQLRTLAPGLVGYLASFGALTGAEGVEDTCKSLPRFLCAYGRWSGERFADRITEKCRRLAL